MANVTKGENKDQINGSIKTITRRTRRRATMVDDELSFVNDGTFKTPKTDEQDILDKKEHSFKPIMQEKLQRKLKFLFMNPIEKWKAKRRFPWKFSIQVVKLIFLTIQLVIFANYTSEHITKVEDARKVLRHILLKDWSSDRDIQTYPPNTGPYSVYTKKQFYDHVDHLVQQFANLETSPIAPFSYDDPRGEMTAIKICKSYFKIGKVWAFNDSFDLTNSRTEKCHLIEPEYINSVFNTKNFLKMNNFSIDFNSLQKFTLEFDIKSVFLNMEERWDLPNCMKLNLIVSYSNENHDGLVLINLDINIRKTSCHSSIKNEDGTVHGIICNYLLVSAIMLLCVTSLILCLRSIIQAHILQIETKNFFERYLSKKLPLSDQTEFLNLWYVMIIISDVLVIAGSVLKLLMTQSMIEKHTELHTLCTMFLGIGNMLMWSGMLRYLGFFPKYNILILTLKNAIPDVLRFTFCVSFLYFGYAMCGWLVLGPYHFKFRTLVRTSECLFSLINLDDMFATYQMVSEDASGVIAVFSQIYFYSFVLLFVYVILSLFTAIILESYELIREYYQNGFPKSLLMEFIAQCHDEADGNAFLQDRNSTWTKQGCLDFIKCRSKESEEPEQKIRRGSVFY